MSTKKPAAPKATPVAAAIGTVAAATVAAANAVATAEGNPKIANAAEGIAAANVAAAEAKPKARASAAKPEPTGTVTRLIDPTKIARREGWNPRFDFGEIDNLAKSIEHEFSVNPSNGGLINDLRVEQLAKKDKDGNEYILIDGDRRLTAIEKLIKKGIKISVVGAKVEPARKDDGNVDAVHKDQLVRMYTANTGKNFLPMEEAVAFERMKKAGMTQKEIEVASGRSHGVVARAFLLLKADKRLRDAVEAKQITASAAVAIQSASRGDPELLDELITEALSAKTAKAKKAVKAKVKTASVKKARKEGRKLKMRALTDEQLSQLGAKMSELLLADMKALGLAENTKLTDWLKGCEADVKLGYSFGVLQALKAAAGAPVELIAG